MRRDRIFPERPGVSSSGEPPQPRRPAPGTRGVILGVFGILVVLILAAKFLFFSSSEKTVDFLPSTEALEEAKVQQLPLDRTAENRLLFGGALQKVQDFEPIVQDAAYWTVFRDVKQSDPKAYENAPFSPGYTALIANPEHYRFLGQPMRIRGIMNQWTAYPAGENAAGVQDVYRSWIFDTENGYVLDGWERPPVEEAGLQRAVVETTGLFYQIARYQTGVPMSGSLRGAGLLLKRGSYENALKKIQELLEQDPKPALVAKFTREVGEVDGSVWDEFKSKGPEYAAVFKRLEGLAEKGLAEVYNADVPEQYLYRNAPFFIAKSIRVLEREQGGFEKFMDTKQGMILGVGFICLLVVGFIFFFLRLQQSSERKFRRRQDDFWREVRRNLKGVDRGGEKDEDQGSTT